MPGPCWTCGWQQIGGVTFLGWCRWFETRGLPKKEIPGRVVDQGCQQWKPKVGRGEPFEGARCLDRLWKSRVGR